MPKTIKEKLEEWYNKISKPSRQGGLDNPPHFIKFKSELPDEIIKSHYLYPKGVFVLNHQNRDFYAFKYTRRIIAQD